ncbi:hypothetical protein ACH5RR_002594, partial [Cinchona calisaya]
KRESGPSPRCSTMPLRWDPPRPETCEGQIGFLLLLAHLIPLAFGCFSYLRFLSILQLVLHLEVHKTPPAL